MWRFAINHVVPDVSEDRSTFEILRTTQQMTVCHNLENKSVITQFWETHIPQIYHINQTGPFADKFWLLIWLKMRINRQRIAKPCCFRFQYDLWNPMRDTRKSPFMVLPKVSFAMGQSDFLENYWWKFSSKNWKYMLTWQKETM